MSSGQDTSQGGSSDTLPPAAQAPTALSAWYLVSNALGQGMPGNLARSQAMREAAYSKLGLTGTGR